VQKEKEGGFWHHGITGLIARLEPINQRAHASSNHKRKAQEEYKLKIPNFICYLIEMKENKKSQCKYWI
jgi:hypothetical protein